MDSLAFPRAAFILSRRTTAKSGQFRLNPGKKIFLNLTKPLSFMTRTGKIARLPAPPRQEIDRRLHDSQGPAPRLWDLSRSKINGIVRERQVRTVQ